MKAWPTALLLGSIVLPSPVVAPARAHSSETECVLFVLARSKNANVVEYAARVVSDGRLDAHAPIDAHWVLAAEDGRREALGFVERRLAYGVTTRMDSTGEACDLEIVSLPSRPIRVRRTAAAYEADAIVGGVTAKISRIFVTTDESGALPHVLSAEIWGQRLTDGAVVYERISPP